MLAALLVTTGGDTHSTDPHTTHTRTHVHTHTHCLQGIVSGHVEGPAEPTTPSANIMNSALYKLALGESMLKRRAGG